MKLSILTSATFAILAVAPAASAGSAPRWAELQAGRVSTPPATADRPAAIPRTESVPGLFAVTGGYPKHAGTVQTAFARSFAARSVGKSSRPFVAPATPATPVSSVIVVGSAAAADQLRSGSAVATAEATACVGQTAQAGMTSFVGATPTVSAALAGEWSHLGAQATIYRSSDGVVAIHGERIVEEGGAARLESTDAWLDTGTHGMRLIGKTSLPLRLVASEPGGHDVFVGRDDRADGKRLVQFVVRRRAGAPTSPIAGAKGAIIGVRIDGSGAPLTASGCAHLRLAMAASANASDTAVLQLTAVLPPLPPGERSSAAPIDDFGIPPATPMKEIRMRALQLHFGVSQLATEQEPLVAISAAWAGREQLQRVPATLAP